MPHSMTPYHLRFLGPVEITQHAEAVGRLESRKALALFCYTVVQDKALSRGHLAAMFWEDKPEPRGRGNLSRVLHNISRRIPGCIQADRNFVRFVGHDYCWLDTVAFNALVEKGELHTVSAATELYRGEFLEGLDLDDCPEFELWLTTERERWRQRMVDAFQMLVTHHLERGEHEQGLRFATRLLQVDPWREEAHRQKMVLLYLSDRRNAALAQYEICQALLAEELGVEPAPETTELYRRLLHADAVSAVTVRPAADAPPLVGRAEDHAWLMRRWAAVRAGTGKLTLVEGDTGRGKTRLIEEILTYSAGVGALVLRGTCHEFGTELPYQALAEALRPLVGNDWGHRRADSDTEPGGYGITIRDLGLADPWLAELGRLLPELQERYPNLTTAGVDRDNLARQRLFEATARLLEALLGRCRGVVLFLDDMHWIDRASVDLLHYLVHRLHQQPVWFLGAYSQEEQMADHSLVQLRAVLARQDLVTARTLEPLDSDAVFALVRIFDGLSADHIRQLTLYLHHRSEGNPFILNQLLADLKAQGILFVDDRVWQLDDRALALRWQGMADVPARVQAMFMDRVQRLEPEARYVLQVAAVIGQEFDLGLLGQVSGVAASQLEVLLEIWRRQRLVHETLHTAMAPLPHLEPSQRLDLARLAPVGDADERMYGHVCAFSHNMIRQAIYDELPDRQRQRIHGRVAAALKALRVHCAGDAEEMAGLIGHHEACSSDDVAE